MSFGVQNMDISFRNYHSARYSFFGVHNFLNLNDMSQEATGKASSFILSISVTDADKGKCLPIDHPPRIS